MLEGGDKLISYTIFVFMQRDGSVAPIDCWD
jgi:hypothetical protein